MFLVVFCHFRSGRTKGNHREKEIGYKIQSVGFRFKTRVKQLSQSLNMEIIIIWLASSLIWAIGFPVVAYPYYKKLKQEYNCSVGILVFSILTGLLNLATPFIAYWIFVLVWFNKAFAIIPLLIYPLCVTSGLYLFYKSFANGKTNKSVGVLIAIWAIALLLILSTFSVLNLYQFK